MEEAVGISQLSSPSHSRLGRSLARQACDGCRLRKARCDTSNIPMRYSVEPGASPLVSGRAMPEMCKAEFVMHFPAALQSRALERSMSKLSLHSMKKWNDVRNP
jgi:hypothetical protein